eukprot:9419427-Heterocapsa_arctica.AAC.1
MGTESVLPLCLFDPRNAGITGLDANAFHWKMMIAYLQVKHLEGHLAPQVFQALASLQVFERLFLQNAQNQPDTVTRPPPAEAASGSADRRPAADPNDWLGEDPPDWSWKFPDNVLKPGNRGAWHGAYNELRGYADRILKILQQEIPVNHPGLVGPKGWIRMQDLLSLDE